jgi:hypothetical protein
VGAVGFAVQRFFEILVNVLQFFNPFLQAHMYFLLYYKLACR